MSANTSNDFTSLNLPRLAAVRTPCTHPDCSHLASYGNHFCCAAFRMQVQGWVAAEASRLQITHPTGWGKDGGRSWVDARTYIHWSGGTASLPEVRILRDAPGGWHNGCFYGGSEAVASVTMSGFEAVRG